MRVTRWSDGPLPWSQCRNRGRHSLIIFAGLERALHYESSIAVALAWGVSRITIWKCRQALGLETSTPGTNARRSEICTPMMASGSAAARRSRAQQLESRKLRAQILRDNRSSHLSWIPEVVELMGVLSDRENARRTGHAAQTVMRERRRRGGAASRRSRWAAPVKATCAQLTARLSRRGVGNST